MNMNMSKKGFFGFALAGLLIGYFTQMAHADGCATCSAGQGEQKVRFHVSGIGKMAGTANITITYGDTTYTATMSGGSVVWSAAHNRYEVARFDCVQWDQEIVVEPKLDQPVKITYNYVTDNQSPSYTEFQNVGGLNPIDYVSRPSSPCLKLWFDSDDGNWVQTTVFVTQNQRPGYAVERLKGRFPKMIPILATAEAQ